MNDAATEADVVSKAESVRKLGKIHHQISAFHKRQAKLCMQRFEDFQRQLEELGIKFVNNDAEERSHLHGQQNTEEKF